MTGQSSSPQSGPVRPEELPPVTPPSAGFIVQLFLIPALIVMGVVSVWALFGKLADSESDWTALVSELGSNNEHRRWRAAQGLAQLIRNDQASPPVDREPLARNPDVAIALTALLKDSLASTTPSDEDLTHQQFIARALGALEADDVTLPVLAIAMEDGRDLEVRKSALMAVAAIAGRHFDAETGFTAEGGEDKPASERKRLTSPTITNAAVLEQLKRAAQSPEAVIRHLSGFALGNVGGEASIEQLKVMLFDGDRAARANAVTGMARNGSVEAVPALIALLKEVQIPLDTAALKGKPEKEIFEAEQRYQVEQPQLARNCLRAVLDLWALMTPEQRQEIRPEVTNISEKFFAPDVRLQASALAKRIAAE
ncbi:MAG: HEAT repeat domain-containing protein [Planctomycetaceae bacterium]|nr:HEAT repeat domain-containing protein [Planctomycetaceae bacterium]